MHHKLQLFIKTARNSSRGSAEILAIVEFGGDDYRAHYVRWPFQREPDFSMTIVNYRFSDLLARAEAPR